MAELTIVFRLRFAVALTVALGLLLVLQARDASALDDSADEYIVQMESGYSPAQGEQIVAELGGQVTTPDLPVINGFGAMLQDDVAEELESRPSVRDVTLNSSTTLGDETVSGGGRCPVADATTRATTLRPNTLDVSPLVSLPLLRQPLQYTVRADRAWWRGSGRGVGVAVVDTGIAGDLPDFYTGGQSRVIASAVTNPCAKNATDNVGHGTHVAGLIAGNSLNYPGLRRLMGRYMGIAPRANLVSVKVSDDGGDTTVLDVINGLQFVVDNKDALGIRVVNLSLSSSVAESYKTDPLDAAVEAAWFSGIVVVAAAGNDADAPGAVSYAPGNDPFVITAGALDDRGSTRLDDDVLAPWSSRGMTQDGIQKPEVLAPGDRLIAALAPKSDFEHLCRRCVVGKNYFRLSGTSMSSAVVSGVAALVIQVNPGMTPNQVKGAILSTRREVPGPRTAASPPTR
jgi:serine protease AprX